MALVGLFESVEGSDAGVVVVVEGKAAVESDGDEAVVTFRSVAFEAAWHGGDGREHTPLIAMRPR